jgi:hypothetical protein
VGEPTTGLISQPARSLLRAWDESPGTIAAFMAILAMPWSFKPVFGMLSALRADLRLASTQLRLERVLAGTSMSGGAMSSERRRHFERCS